MRVQPWSHGHGLVARPESYIVWVLSAVMAACPTFVWVLLLAIRLPLPFQNRVPVLLGERLVSCHHHWLGHLVRRPTWGPLVGLSDSSNPNPRDESAMGVCWPGFYRDQDERPRP